MFQQYFLMYSGEERECSNKREIEGGKVQRMQRYFGFHDQLGDGRSAKHMVLSLPPQTCSWRGGRFACCCTCSNHLTSERHAATTLIQCAGTGVRPARAVFSSVGCKRKKNLRFESSQFEALNEVYLRNFLHRWVVNRETNLTMQINPWLINN